MRVSALVLAAGLVIAAGSSTVGAQVRGQPMRPDTLRPGQRQPARPANTRPDSARVPGDTTAADTTQKILIEWAEPDSVMLELMDRPGYIVTRYQGEVVRMAAQTNELRLEGDPSAVSREGVLLVGDTILYNDATRNVTVLGDTVTLRDPSRGSDVVASGFLRYDLTAQRGVVQNVRTSTETGGETWYVHSARASLELPDSASGGNPSLYGRGGHLTSCDLTEPHYHFGVREVKVIRNQVLVARPAILYISDIPVAWLPFPPEIHAPKRSLPADRMKWLSVRDQIYEDIMQNGWDSEVQAFVQAYDSKALDASNLIMPLVFFTAPNDPRMLATIDAIRKPVAKGGLGAGGLIYRYHRHKNIDGLGTAEGTFNMCSFWLVEALTRAGRTDRRRLEEARLLFDDLLGYANHLGLYAEQTGPTGEALGNFPQAFTHLALISAAFNLDRALSGMRVG